MANARTTTAERTQPGGLVLLCLAAWAIPGLGHLWLGRRSKGLIFFVALPLMFAIGLTFKGRIFPFDFSDPLVGLEAFAQFGIGVLFFLAAPLGYGRGDAHLRVDNRPDPGELGPRARGSAARRGRGVGNRDGKLARCGQRTHYDC